MTTRILTGHVMDKLAELPDESVHCCVSSPPYFGLRSYGTEPQVWGGDPDCSHVWEIESVAPQSGGTGDASAKQVTNGGTQGNVQTKIDRAFCFHCNAWRGSLGLEPSPELYIAHLVEVFREVRRVLRNDGTLWLNIGDCYSVRHIGRRDHGTACASSRLGPDRTGIPNGQQINASGDKLVPGMKPKNLIGIPWMLAFALRADGWWLRSEIAWCKRAPMPESVTDRPTSAHEKVFLLTRSPRYFYDAEAVKEDSEYPDDDRKSRANPGKEKAFVSPLSARVNPGSATYPKRNLRNVWHLGPEPFPDAHFACVDHETEALTWSGWKRHDQLAKGEIIASYDMERQRLCWKPIDAVSRYEVIDEPMIRAQGMSLDMLLTRNHRCIIRRRQLAGGLCGPKIKRVDALAFADHIPTAADWDDVGDNFDPAWAELLGWYVAEGHALANSMTVEISQSLSVNAPHVARLRSLLVHVDADWSEATARRDWRGREALQSYFKIRGFAAAKLRSLAPHKKLTIEVLKWNHEALQAIFDGLINGDGHTRADGRMSFIQKDRHLADLVQAIAIRLGRSACLSQRQGGTWTVFLTKHTSRSLRGTGGNGALIVEERYTGTVWCPQTEHGTWVARRNGRVFITGNTFPTEIPRRAILAGTSERGVCPKCGAPWVRITAKSASGGEARDGINRGTDERGIKLRAGECGAKTIGWRPTCSCAEWHCPSCATGLDTWDARAKDLSGVQGRIPSQETGERLLQSSVLQSKDCAHTQDDERLDDHQQGLSDDHGSRPSECDPIRLRDGTSACSREGDWPLSDARGSGAPQERRSAGQSPGEPRIDDQAATRWSSKAAISRRLPALPSDVSIERKCPDCGSILERTTPDPIPGVVLDCFLGAGTTALVADQLGRDCIGIELNSSYAKMAENRLRDDAGMFVSIAGE